MRDYYKILQIPSGSSLNDVKKAYRKLAHLYHPDVSSFHDARERFIEINEAYEYLLNKIELEENLNKWNQSESYETSQTIIDAWIAAEQARIREQARRYSQMKYSNFKKTEIYKTTIILNNTLNYFNLLLGLIVLFGSIYGSWSEIKRSPLYLNPSYIFSTLIICSIGIIMIGYSIVKIKGNFKRKK